MSCVLSGAVSSCPVLSKAIKGSILRVLSGRQWLSWLLFQSCTEQVCQMPLRPGTLTEDLLGWKDILSEDKPAEHKEGVFFLRDFYSSLNYYVDFMYSPLCCSKAKDLLWRMFTRNSVSQLSLFNFSILPHHWLLLERAQLDHGFWKAVCSPALTRN